MDTAKCCRCDARACAVALARWVIGVVLLFAGIAKLPNVGGFVTQMTSMFEKTWLPKALLVPYAYALPFAEVALGAFLLLGIARNAVLFVAGLLFITLTFGQLLLGQPIVFQNMMYTVVTAAILFAESYDQCVLPLGNRRPVESPTPQRT
jgi:thiosulfate dehydrogenase (quinone) large subunit